MTPVNQNSLSPDEQAAAWFAALQGENISTDKRARFEEWCAADVSHVRAFEKIGALWQGMDAFASSDAVERQLADAKYQKKKVDFGRLFLPLAACVALLVMTIPTLREEMFDQSSYETAIGERENITLPDGSEIRLNTNTELVVDYSDEERRIILERGQAYFVVTKNPDRPFVVMAGRGSVTALGTAFDVKKSNQDIVVTLIEGSVKVREDNLNEVTLVAGVSQALSHKISFNPQGFGEAGVTKTREIVAWQEDKIIFDARPLGEAIEEVNRYLTDKIIIGDPALNQILISGVFRTGNRDVVTRALESYFPLKIMKGESGQMVILPQGSAQDRL